MTTESDETTDKEQGETSAEDRIFKRLETQSKIHLIVSIIGIPLMMAVLSAGLINLGKLHKITLELNKSKPASLEDVYSKKIAKVKLRAENQYKQYRDKMESSKALSENNKLTKLFEYTVSSEADFVSFLEAYKDLSYDTASKVKGSGEWYFYFNKSLEEIVDKGKVRHGEISKTLLKTTI
jgi:hypothetical protein